MASRTFTSLPPLVTALQHGDHSAILLEGPLGAGKTYLTQQLAKALGVTAPVVSPTFTIMNVYPLPKQAPWQQLVHYDWYRLPQPTQVQLEDLQYFDLLSDPSNLLVMEWPENLPKQWWPDRYQHVIITPQGETRTYLMNSTHG